MTSKKMLIIRDILYAIMVILLLVLPENTLELSLTIRVGIAILMLATRVWQHINYYKATGKIY